jgi:hypothetical protein
LTTSNLPEVPLGKTAVSIAMCPCSTRVNERRCAVVGVPKCSVRVTSVVPSRYCPENRLSVWEAVRTANLTDHPSRIGIFGLYG